MTTLPSTPTQTTPRGSTWSSSRDPLHPNPRGDSCLNDIPSDNSERTSLANDGSGPFCKEIKPDGSRCRKPTRSVCESKFHNMAEPICDDCNKLSKQRIYDSAESTFVEAIRAYACHSCLDKATWPATYNQTGYRVYGIGQQADGMDSSVTTVHDDIPDIPMTSKVGGFQGQLLPITGCACAEKLLNRHLCNPHRVQRMLDMRQSATKMRQFIKASNGKMVCPFCQINAGVDGYNFRSVRGGEGKRLAWGCLSCHSYVVAGATHRGPVPGGAAKFAINTRSTPEPPQYYNDDVMEGIQ